MNEPGDQRYIPVTRGQAAAQLSARLSADHGGVRAGAWLDGLPTPTEHKVVPATCPMRRSAKDCQSDSVMGELGLFGATTVL